MTEVAKIERNAIDEYRITQAEVKELVSEYMVLTVLPDDPDSYEVADTARKKLIKVRTSGDKRRKKLGEDARDWVSDCNGAYKTLFDPVFKAEDHVKAELKTEDDRVEAIRQKKIAEEVRWVDNITRKIEEIKHLGYTDPQLPSDLIRKQMLELEAVEIDDDVYGEYTDDALAAHAHSGCSLQTALDKELKWEETQAAAKVEADRLEKVRLEQEAKEKALADERAKIAKFQASLDARQAKLEAEKKAEADKKESEELEAKTRKNITEMSRSNLLEAVGFTYPFNDLGTMPDLQWSEMYEKHRKAWEPNQNKILLDNLDAEMKANEKAEVEREARAEALKPDKAKLNDWADRIGAVESPDVKDEWFIGYVQDIEGRLDRIRLDIMDTAEGQ